MVLECMPKICKSTVAANGVWEKAMAGTAENGLVHTDTVPDGRWQAVAGVARRQSVATPHNITRALQSPPDLHLALLFQIAQ